MVDDARRGSFARVARVFLDSHPIENSILLTETAYLQAISSTDDDQVFGWFDQRGVVTGAFVQAPRHPPVVSPLTQEAFESLTDVLPELTSVGVDGRDVTAASRAWQRLGTALEPRALIDVQRLAELRPPLMPDGAARVATAAAARGIARHVLVFAAADDRAAAAEYADLGFEPVAQRCLLGAVRA